MGARDVPSSAFPDELTAPSYVPRLLGGPLLYSAHDIAERTGKSPTALRPLLRALVSDGLVTATAPPTSRNRAYLLAE